MRDKQIVLNNRKPELDKAAFLIIVLALLVAALSVLLITILGYLSLVLLAFSVLLLGISSVIGKFNIDKYNYDTDVYVYRISNWYEVEDKEFDGYVKEEGSNEQTRQEEWVFVKEQKRSKISTDVDTNEDNDKKRNMLFRRKQLQQNSSADNSRTGFFEN